MSRSQARQPRQPDNGPFGGLTRTWAPAVGCGRGRHRRQWIVPSSNETHLILDEPVPSDWKRWIWLQELLWSEGLRKQCLVLLAVTAPAQVWLVWCSAGHPVNTLETFAQIGQIKDGKTQLGLIQILPPKQMAFGFGPGDLAMNVPVGK
ncbi:hypothetical protein E5288_WYG008237 [Bos mutus]|uniref:Uncharacterized protein n=1 Tax=Bos mutus TaxID=72004 RepID=A0A6B0S1R1_9CETA|nr:hypothetical protein [Bos mutus]